MARVAPFLKQKSRQLRGSMTDAEQHLWRCLRLRQITNLKFCRQHPACGYILDFACVEISLAIELDGGQHADSIAADNLRTEVLNQAGWKVIRFWNNDVLINLDAVLTEIHRCVGELQPPSQPSP